jgi:hypothetical protein
MMKMLCLLVSVLAVLPSSGVESARPSDFRIKEFERNLLSAINKENLVEVRHELRRFAHIECSPDEKNKLLNDLICMAEDKAEEISQNKDYLLVAAGGGLMCAYFWNIAYAIYKVGHGKSYKPEAGIVGLIGAFFMGMPVLFFVGRNTKLRTMQLICQAIEDARNTSTFTTTSEAKS